MLFRLYFESIGPVSLISAYTDWLQVDPYHPYHIIYWPLLWPLDYYPVTHSLPGEAFTCPANTSVPQSHGVLS